VGQGVSWRKRWQPTSGGHEIESLQCFVLSNVMEAVAVKEVLSAEGCEGVDL